MTITGKTGLTGLFGDPVAHSVSPAIHNTAYGLLGLDMAYLPFHVKPSDLPRAVDGIRALAITGVNCTIPHKQAVLPLLDRISEEAELIGAVNTIVNKNGTLTGHTTDAAGFITSTRSAGVEITGKRITILGGGGSARSLAAGLALRMPPAGITLLGRTVARVDKIAGDITGTGGVPVTAAPLTHETLARVLPETDLLVNCTSVGMHPHVDASPVSATLLHPGLAVHDIVYNPLETQLLADARKTGCTVIDGLGMLLHQGIAAFELWTGQKPPVEPLRTAAIKALGL